MNLRNKKTGEIMDDAQYRNYSLPDGFGFRIKDKEWEYHSLAELNEEWEDYEEPKESYFIDSQGDIQIWRDESCDDWSKEKSIGNYFDTREEAEKAVEKLKAWKRLKEKGFRFTGINDDEDSQELITQCGILCEAGIYHLEKDPDFLLLFGGEE